MLRKPWENWEVVKTDRAQENGMIYLEISSMQNVFYKRNTPKLCSHPNLPVSLRLVNTNKKKTLKLSLVLYFGTKWKCIRIQQQGTGVCNVLDIKGVQPGTYTITYLGLTWRRCLDLTGPWNRQKKWNTVNQWVLGSREQANYWTGWSDIWAALGPSLALIWPMRGWVLLWK